MDMNKLLFVFENDMPTISTMRLMFKHIEAKYGLKSEFVYLSDVNEQAVNQSDIIIFVRPMDIFSWKIAKMAKDARHLVVTFLDDDLLNLPKSMPTIPWRKKGLIKVLSYSDIIWSTSSYIANNYMQYTSGKRIALSDTVVREEELPDLQERKAKDRVRIVYAAASSHASLFDKYVNPIITKLFSEFNNKIELTFVGVHPKVDVPCEYVQGMPLMKYRQYMKDSHFDIGLAPLGNDEFSKCKYFNKYLEYTIQGIVGVYSNTEPYTFVVENNRNGFLAENNYESWYETLKKVITDCNLRTNCLKNAVQNVMENFSDDAVFKRFCQYIPELLEENKVYMRCKNFTLRRIVYYASRPFDFFYLIIFYMKSFGLKEVVRRAKTHIFGHAYSRKKTKTQ